MTNLRKQMLEELQRRNYSAGTICGYLQAVQQVAVHFGRSPDKLGPAEVRTYQAYLLTEPRLRVTEGLEFLGLQSQTKQVGRAGHIR